MSILSLLPNLRADFLKLAKKRGAATLGDELVPRPTIVVKEVQAVNSL